MITLHQIDRVKDVEDGRGKFKTVHFESPDVVVNPNYIVAMVQHDDRTAISMVNGNTFVVKETVKEIIEKISHEVDGVYQAFIV